ncbi:MAG: VWA domain-containing protein [Balneolales bacterium]
MNWANPEWFWVLLILPLIGGSQLWYYAKKRYANLTFSDVHSMKGLPGNWRSHGFWAASLMQLFAVMFIILALARPQQENVTVERTVEGIDIMLVLDISSSMLAEDLKPNRLDAVKEIAQEFVEARDSDRMGAVVFAREAVTISPLTLDHVMLKSMLDKVDLGIVRDGTAIGMGFATAVNRIKDSDAESRVIILLTDGENNAGEIDPVTAGELAKAHGVRVYTIGASSTEETAPYPIDDPIFGRRYHNIKVDIDEEMMAQIAESTGGSYFRATDNESLRLIYDEIDQLERSEVEELRYTDNKDIYPRFLFSGIFLIVLSLLSDKLIFRNYLS